MKNSHLPKKHLLAVVLASCMLPMTAASAFAATDASLEAVRRHGRSGIGIPRQAGSAACSA